VPAPGTRSAAATFVTLGLAYGVWYSYSVFLVALLREFGWSRSVLAGAFSVFTLVHGLASAPLGVLADRFGPRRLVLAGGVLLALALLLDSVIARPWHLYLAFGLCTSLGVAAAGWTPAVVLIQHWFPRRMGTVLGFTSAGIGVGIFLVVPLCQYLIDLAGWRAAFRLIGGLLVLWIVPATLLLVRDPPRPAPATPAGPTVGQSEMTPRAALRARSFWLLAAVNVCTGFVNQMLFVHQVAYLVDHDVPALVAASVVGVIGIASIVGKSVGGWASDRFGREATFTFGYACVLASVGCLGALALRPGHALPAYGYGLLIGLGYAVTAPLMPAVVADLYRGRHFGAIFGMVQFANALGSGVGPWLAGRIFDRTGSYASAFAAAVVMAVLATVALWLAAPRRARARL
jgi:MFS family permease